MIVKLSVAIREAHNASDLHLSLREVGRYRVLINRAVCRYCQKLGEIANDESDICRVKPRENGYRANG
jgi:hypothetical protein